MRKTFILLTLGILAMVTVPVVALAGQLTGHAQMHSIGGSGITGIISFQDDGTDLYVLGTANGLDAAKRYISLIYDNGSVLAGGDACRRADGGIDMDVGEWDAVTGELNVVKLVYEPLGNFITISIRDCNGPCDDRANPLQACGVVEVHKVKKPKKKK